MRDQTPPPQEMTPARWWSARLPERRFHGPGDLGTIALDYQQSDPTSAGGPNGEHRVRALVEEAYFAGMAREEGRNLTFQVLHVDEKTTDYLAFETPVSYEARNIIKLAPAASIENDTALCVRDVERSRDFPHGLQIAGIGYRMAGILWPPGHIAARMVSTRWWITCLSAGHVRFYINGPTLELIRGKIEDLLPMNKILPYVEWETEVSRSIMKRVRDSRIPSVMLEHEPWAEWNLRTTLGYILSVTIRRIREAGHGGCLLILPSSQWDDAARYLDFRYRHDERSAIQRGQLIMNYVEMLARYRIAEKENRDAFAAITHLYGAYQQCKQGALSFAQLSQVDGAVVLSRDLQLKGFGAEILERGSGSEEELILECPGFGYEPCSARGLTRYGTRHRSAFRFCRRIPGTLAFVISQDGDLRIMYSSGDKVYLWDRFTESEDY